MTDSADRWRRVQEICHAALDLSGEQRDAYLESACDDPDIRRQVDQLLAQETGAERFLETSAAGVMAAAVLSGKGATLSGTRLNGLEIGALLGAGGMGEVYRARDTKLRRDVAVKILPRSFTTDPDRMARFEREARMLASLNHPHIGAIYGLEEADGIRALVLELVDGETLAERIARGPLALKDALRSPGRSWRRWTTRTRKGSSTAI